MYGGDGLARLDGRVVFTPFVLPGERIRARGGAGEARAGAGATRWKCCEPAPERVAAPCPYFGRCGGCHYQHAPYEYQLASQARDPRRGAAAAGQDRAAGGDRGGLRPSRGATAIARNCTSRTDRLGYREARSHKLCAIDHCPISSPKVNEAIGALVGDAARSAMAAVHAVARGIHRRAAGADQRARDGAAGGAALLRLVRGADSRAW